MKYIFLVAISVLSLVTPLYAAGSDADLRIGYTNRAFYTHFAEYSGGSTSHLWSDFKMNGVNVEYLKPIDSAEFKSLKWGMGAELLFGDNDYESYIPTYTGSTSATGVEIKAFVEASHKLDKQFDIYGDVGASLAYLFSDAGSQGTGAVSSSYSVGLPEIYAVVGGKYAMGKNESLTFGYRFTVAGLGSWTDTYFSSSMYEIDPYTTGIYISYVSKY